MKITAKVVKLDSPTGKEEDCVYTEFGFLKEIQVFNGEELIHKSGANHPQCPVTSYYKGIEFYTPSYGGNVYVKVCDEITIDFN